jgi:RNA polymerase sigma factor (sigma-70 family)
MAAGAAATTGVDLGKDPGAQAEDCERLALDGLQEGDHHRVITFLMKAYGDLLHAYCRSMVGDDSHASDVLQVVFLQAYGALPGFERRSSLKAWLFGIARHRCLDELKHARRWARRLHEWRSVASPTAQSPEPEEPRLDAQRSRALEACMQRLPVETRDLVLLRFRYDLSYEEIGALTRLPAGTLRVRLFRALSSLRRCLEQQGMTP